MKRRYQTLLSAPLLASILLVAGPPIAWFDDSASAASAAPPQVTSTVQALFNTNTLVVTGTDANDEIFVTANGTGELIVTNYDVIVPINVISGVPTENGTSVVVVLGGDGNDSINILTGFVDGAVLLGERGDDILSGVAQMTVVKNGGDGNDILIANTGITDIMMGGNGNDTLRGTINPGKDSHDGGEGIDTFELIFPPNIETDTTIPWEVGIDPTQPDQAVVVLGALPIPVRNIEDIALSTQPGPDSITINDLTGTAVKIVRVNGGGGNDTISGVGANVDLVLDGGDGNDILRGGLGSDSLRGGFGTDRIFGGGGSDTISARDGQRDLISCGDAADRVLIDPPGTDIVSRDCESVNPP
jgi:Ca2+-binding RTX toxin-like protein